MSHDAGEDQEYAELYARYEVARARAEASARRELQEALEKQGYSRGWLRSLGLMEPRSKANKERSGLGHR